MLFPGVVVTSDHEWILWSVPFADNKRKRVGFMACFEAALVLACLQDETNWRSVGTVDYLVLTSSMQLGWTILPPIFVQRMF
jgi:hypothetical protein